ncbi:hypothetical protein HJG60_011602 [Phyllostomus discolor]|uniref:Uncharacterized protein n=1 Tax=Phyllostomus discolor TaxID=89673 RepID=A0A834E3A8_9CHIR|nr:hypothetical protein HJG60_011602 [Phyllostomus discolor]
MGGGFSPGKTPGPDARRKLRQQEVLRLGWIAALGPRGLARASRGSWPGGVSRGGQKQEHPQPSQPSSRRRHALTLHVVMELRLLGGREEGPGLPGRGAVTDTEGRGQRARGRREESWHLGPILGIQGTFEQSGAGVALRLLSDPISAQLWQKGSGPCRAPKGGS